MKKFLSILCVLTLVIGVLAVSAVSVGAVESAQTSVDVAEGDEVVYSLHLEGVAKPIIGCDFSFYYDPEMFEVESISDFNESTENADWLATINPTLEGEVRGNWSILNGIDFSSERNFITITYKAKKAGSGHLSYYIRYMYDETIFDDYDAKPQITDYKFTCTVKVNGEPVIEKGEPELNVEETQSSGLFVNSVTGDSKDADPDIPNTVVTKTDTSGSGNNGNNANNAANNNANNGANNNAAANNNANNANNKSNNSNKTVETKVAELGTTADGYYITATDAAGNVAATSDEAPVTVVETTGTNDKGGSSPAIWIIIGLVVLAGGGAAVYFFTKKKTPAADAQSAADTSEAETNDNSDAE